MSTTCDVQQLLIDGKCYSLACLSPGQQRIVLLQLLCEIANGGGGGGGVTSIIAGAGISVDAATGAVTITNTNLGGASATSQWLLANLPAVQYTSQTRDGDNVVTTGTALWPDGSGGTYTLTTKNATWLAADAWTLTHTLSGKTLTQSAVTRNASGYCTATPAITIA